MSRCDRIALCIGLLAAIGWVVVYVRNPFHTPSWNPIARVFGVNVLRASTNSMEPTLEQGTIFIANSWPFVGKEPESGDVVTFWHSRDPKAQYVKRIVATGGDRIEMVRCTVRINGRELPEPYAIVRGPGPLNLCELDEVEIPMGNYFLLGDNRLNSEDSRIWGSLPRENIIGRVDD